MTEHRDTRLGRVSDVPAEQFQAGFLRGDITGALIAARRSDQASPSRSSPRPWSERRHLVARWRAAPTETRRASRTETLDLPEVADRADPLTALEVVKFLIERDLLDPATVVAGDLRLVEASRRNSNLKIMCTHGASYFVKQGRGFDARATIENEAAAYRWLGIEKANTRRLSYIPRCYSHDSEHALLVLELLPDARSLTEHLALVRRASREHARAIGRALGNLHMRGGDAGVPDGISGGQARPSILSVHRPTLRILCSISRANLSLTRLVQQFPSVGGLLDDLRAGWICDGIVHGDLKADNCVVARSAGGRHSRVAIVDWELCGIGDTAWDVGSVFNNYLSLWLQSIPIAGDYPPDHYLDLAGLPLNRIQSSLREFWAGYLAARHLGGRAAASFLLRSTRYCGAALLKTAHDQMRGSSQLTGKAVCLIQLGLNVMQRPEEAAMHLVGIGEEFSAMFVGDAL